MADYGGDNQGGEAGPLISVRLLGALEVSCNGLYLKSLPRRAASVLAYLVTNRSQPHTRDLLAGRFWSETSDDKARRQLSNAIWQIRKAASEAGLPDFIFTDRGRVGIDNRVDVAIDAEQYEADLDAAITADPGSAHSVRIDALTAAVETYTGDYLSGYYDDWMESERRRLRNRQADALSRLTALYRGASDYQRALRLAEDLAELDPLREESHREVMRLHGILGNAAAAERQYETCRRILNDEVGVEPSSDTLSLLAAIRSDDAPVLEGAVGGGRSGQRMVGRARERAELVQLLNELTVGRGGVALIEGEAGIGKSRLVEDMLDRAEFLGLRALVAAHSAISVGDPYHAFREMLTPLLVGLRAEHVAEAVAPVWLRQVCDLLPGLAPYVADAEPKYPLLPEEETARTSEALARVLLTQGSTRPTVMVFEDVHWADSDSMRVFGSMLSRLAASGILVVLTYRRFEAQRSASVWSTIVDLDGAESSTVLRLGPLSEAEAQELVVNSATAAAWSDGGHRDRVVAGSGGNPLYLLEALRDPSILTADWSDRADAAVADSNFPAALRLAIADRVGDLDANAKLVLATLAVLAERSTGGRIHQIVGLGRVETLMALELLVDRNLIAESEQGEYHFLHEQTRRVVLAILDDEQVAGCHQRAFRVFSVDEDVTPDRLAYHARLGALWAEANLWYSVAGRQAVEVNSFAVAADHFRYGDEAAENAERPVADRLDELLEFERVLDIIGNRADQQSLLKRLDDVEMPDEQRLRVRERKAWLLLNSDEIGEALRSVEAWVDWAADRQLSRYELLMVWGEARYRSGDVVHASEPLRQARELALAVDDRSSMVSASSLLARVLIDTGEVAEAEQLLDEAMEAAVELNNIRSQIDILSIRFMAAHSNGDHDLAVGCLEQTVERSRAVGYRIGEVRNLVNLGSFHTAHGQAGRALRLFGDAADLTASLSHRRFEAFICLNLAELKHRLLGEDVEAAGLARSAAGYFKSVGDHRRETVALCKLCRIDWRAGRRRLAKTRLRHLIARAASSQETFAEVEARRIAAEFAFEAEDYETAARELDVALEKCGQDLAAWVRPAIEAHRGLIATYTDEMDLARQLTSRALPSVEGESEFAFVTAWQCGTSLSRLGLEDEAARQFRVAFKLLESNLDGLSDQQYREALAIPELAAIAESFERVSPRTVQVRLAAVDAPLGRPLEESELVPVQLTVSSPQDWKMTIAAERRRRRILRMCEEAGAAGAAATVADLARLLNVSERTAKRDLKELRGTGESPRTRKNT